MKKTRTLEEAMQIAKRKIFRYILAVQIIYAKRISSLYGTAFDADDVESSLNDKTNTNSYFEQQDDIKRSFCISSDVFRKFTMMRYEGGSRVPIRPIMANISNMLRIKSYNEKGTSSYKVGEYSKMYIFNYKTFIWLCNQWQDTTKYRKMFDLGSDYYKDIIGELKKRFNLKFLDFNKYKYRKDGSNK